MRNTPSDSLGVILLAFLFWALFEVSHEQRWQQPLSDLLGKSRTYLVFAGRVGARFFFLLLSFTIALLMIIELTLLLFFLPNLLSHLKPACAFLANLRTVSIQANLWGILLFPLLAWSLAQLLKGSWDLSGFGTQLRGPGPRFTKWLVCADIPLLPVCSLVVAEDGSLRRTLRLNWPQVRQTWWGSRKAYLIGLLIGLVTNILVTLPCM